MADHAADDLPVGPLRLDRAAPQPIGLVAAALPLLPEEGQLERIPSFFAQSGLLTPSQIESIARLLPYGVFTNDLRRNYRSVMRPIFRLLSRSDTAMAGMDALTRVLALRSPMAMLAPLQFFRAVLQNEKVARLVLTPDVAGPVLQNFARYYPSLHWITTAASGFTDDEDLRGIFMPSLAPSLEQIAPVIDDGWVWMLNYVRNLDVSKFDAEAIPQLRHLFQLAQEDTRGEVLVGGPFVPVPKTKQWMARIAAPANLASLRHIGLSQARSRCREMEDPESKICNNPEGNVVGDPWCDVPAWTYYRDQLGGYCYDMRELLQHVASQVEGNAGAPPSEPSFPYTRRRIVPDLIESWATLAIRNSHRVPINIFRIMQVYKAHASDPQPPAFSLSRWFASSDADGGQPDMDLEALVRQNPGTALLTNLLPPPIPVVRRPGNVRRRLSFGGGAAEPEGVIRAPRRAGM